MTRRRGWFERRSVFVLLATLGALSGCGSPWSVRAAKTGDEASLRKALAREKEEGKLDRDRVVEVAHAVGTRELLSSVSDAAVLRIEESAGCTRPLLDALEKRAQKADDAGAAAKLALIDAEGGRAGDGEELLRTYGTSPSPLYRAVAARAAVGEQLGPARRKYFNDPDEKVRLAALRASLKCQITPTPTGCSRWHDRPQSPCANSRGACSGSRRQCRARRGSARFVRDGRRRASPGHR